MENNVNSILKQREQQRQHIWYVMNRQGFCQEEECERKTHGVLLWGVLNISSSNYSKKWGGIER